MRKNLKKVPAGKKGKGLKKLPKQVRNKMGFMKKGGKVKGYEHGGSVKGKGKCKIDGIAIRGKTRAKRK